MGTWIGLGLALVSALAVNWAYTREHDAASRLPKLSPCRPLRSAKLLLGNRGWLVGFGTESAGWLLYVASLRLAPLALVQAVNAAGIAVLAAAASGGHPGRLARHEQLAVLAALAGLVLLGISLVGSEPSDRIPNPVGAAIWLAACVGGAAAIVLTRPPFARAASLGLATGALFATGDVSAKLVTSGGWWLVALVTLLAGYGLGTSVLQSAFQHGDALTAAGIATMATNALPIAAGFVLFHERLPAGARGVIQVAAFASLVASAALLGRSRAPAAGAGEGRPLGRPAPAPR